MAAQNADTTTVRVDSSIEDENQGGDENETSRQFFHGGRRGVGGNRNPRYADNGRNDNAGFSGRRYVRGGRNLGGVRNVDDRVLEKVAQLSGPTYDLPPLDTTEKKFSGRARLYIGNVAAEASEEELNDLFREFGETNEIFLNKEKNFAFIKLDYLVNAERAKSALDGTVVNGRNLKIRFAANGTVVKVKNLPPFVSNELLHCGFSIFGEIERCIVVVDDRGKPTGEGVIQFSRKGSATLAISKCKENCFFLTSSLRPVIVEPHDLLHDMDGLPDKNIQKKNSAYLEAREIGPRFAVPNSFQYEYGMRWKHLYELYSQKGQALKQEFEMEKSKLQAQMEFARFEHETEMLREQLRSREIGRDRQKQELERRENILEESKQRTEEQMRLREQDVQARIHHQDEELRRRHEQNRLFLQSHQLDDRHESQEGREQPEENAMYNPNAVSDMGPPDNMPMDPKTFLNAHCFRGRSRGIMRGRSRWANDGPLKRPY